MSISTKIVNADDIADSNQSNTALCYGHFNLTHPGHIRYLQHAKSLSSRLIVAIKSDEELDKDSFGEHFSEIERAESIANLQIVDEVVVLNEISLDQLIRLIRPNVLILGKEFESIQSKQIRLAIKAIKECGRVVFHAGETHYANSSLLHDTAFNIESNNRDNFRKICKKHNITINSLQSRLEEISNLELLVVGDTIVDNYVACDAIGMSAEAPVLVVKELENREFIGGAAIVASHIRALGAKCHYISITGDDVLSVLVGNTLREQGVTVDLLIDSSRPTTYKTRYMVESQKLFRVSRIKEHQISKNIAQTVVEKITKVAHKIHGIVISDFVYGVITPDTLEAIVSIAKSHNIKLFGDLQCSSQAGKVTKFQGFDLITPTERESRIALDDNEGGLEWIANTLLHETQSKNMLVKLGSDGFIAYNNNLVVKRQHFPALTIGPVDVTGAGDSLLAAMSTSITSGSDLMEASAIGTCMASLAVSEVGNTPIGKDRLATYIYDVLSD